MNVKFYDLTKAKVGERPKRFYFGLLPYINVSWDEVTMTIFVGMWQYCAVWNISR